MKHLLKFFVVLALCCVSLAAEDLTGIRDRQQFSQTYTVSGSTLLTMDNNLGALIVTFEEVVTGSPVSVSIVISGCMRGGTCDVLETNTTTSGGNRKPTIATIYDYFKVVPSWTGGTSPTMTLNATARGH